MKNFFYNLQVKLQRFMLDRYGYDELSRFLMAISLVFLLISAFIPYIYPVALLFILAAMLRTFSKNIPKRQKEFGYYLKQKDKILKKFNLMRNIWKYRKTAVYCKCPSCKVYIKLPKNKGKLKVSCPKCKNEFIKKT